MHNKIVKTNIKNYIGLAARIQDVFCNQENLEIGRTKSKKKLECIKEYEIAERQKAFELLCTNESLIQHKRFDVIVDAFIENGVVPTAGFEVAKKSVSEKDENATDGIIPISDEVSTDGNDELAATTNDEDVDDIDAKVAPKLINTTKEMENRKGTLGGRLSYTLEYAPKRAHSRMIEFGYKFRRRFGIS